MADIDAQLLRSVNRQLKAIKYMLGFFFVLLIATLAVLGYVTYKVVTFTQDITTKINNFETKTTEQLDLRKQLCDSNTLRNFLQDKSEYCKSE
jgi:hypothetical protein